MIGLLAVFSVSANAQVTAPQQNPLFPKADDKYDPGGGIRDMLKKLEIEKEKKDFEEMQDRAKQAFDLSNELEDSVATNAQFSEKERAKLDELEKLVKRIRKELGGSDDDEKDFGNDDDDDGGKPGSFVDAVKALQTVTGKMYEEVQKTTRFTVSGAAIRTSNAVLRLTRLVRIFR
jgi:hypothetical protein